MTWADLIEHVLPLYVDLAPADPARAFRAGMTWWSWHATSCRVVA